MCREAITELVGVGAVVYKPCHVPRGLKQWIYHLQSSIDAEGFRSLRENEPVEFVVETSEDGRTKAVNVTGPDGAPPQVSHRPIQYSII